MKKDKKYIPQKTLILLLISNFLLSMSFARYVDDEYFLLVALFWFSVFTFLVYFFGSQVYGYFLKIKKWKRRLMISITPILTIPVYFLLESYTLYIPPRYEHTAAIWYISMNIVFLFYCVFAWIYDGYKNNI